MRFFSGCAGVAVRVFWSSICFSIVVIVSKMPSFVSSDWFTASPAVDVACLHDWLPLCPEFLVCLSVPALVCCAPGLFACPAVGEAVDSTGLYDGWAAWCCADLVLGHAASPMGLRVGGVCTGGFHAGVSMRGCLYGGKLWGPCCRGVDTRLLAGPAVCGAG